MSNKYDLTTDECLSVIAWEGIRNLCAGIKENKLDSIVEKNKSTVQSAIIIMISELGEFSLVFFNEEVDYEASNFLKSVNNAIYHLKNTLGENGITKNNAPNLFDLIDYIEYLIDSEAIRKTDIEMEKLFNNIQE